MMAVGRPVKSVTTTVDSALQLAAAPVARRQVSGCLPVAIDVHVQTITMTRYSSYANLAFTTVLPVPLQPAASPATLLLTEH